MIARTVLEAFYFLKYVCEEEGFSDRFVDDSEARRLTLINSILNERPDLVTPEGGDLLEEQRSEIVARGISKASRLQRPQLMGEYYSIYRVLSDYVHPSAWSVEKYLQAQENSDTSFLEWGPNTEDLEQTLMLVSEIVYLSLALLCDLFGLDRKEELEQLNDMLVRLRGIQRKNKKELRT